MFMNWKPALVVPPTTLVRVSPWAFTYLTEQVNAGRPG
jgi:hypothetical protein